MNPYEKTAAEMKRQSEGPKRLMSGPIGKAVGAASLGAAATAGSAAFAPLLARAATLLSEYIPQDLAIKGLSKISPKLGKFVDDALNSGFDFNEAKDFLGKKIKDSQGQAKQDKNIIEQVSPELHTFIDQEIKKGRKPIEAAALAQHDKRFSSIIQKLKNQHKTPWASIIEAIYGTGETVQPNQPPIQGQPPSVSPEQPPNFSGQPQGQQQPGPGMQAISAVLNKINQKLGG